ncbi:MAG: hypothetical protein M0R66_07045 [Candidatus Omnitrophica bacterium]|nr:hypothetical protein [Candidatus Omnitrophota bacterium]
MEEKIILEKFKQWAGNLSPEEARIAVFEHVRDIPYAIIPELRDPHRGPAGILEYNKGSCQPKHYLMGLLFTKLAIPIKYVTYPFKWGSEGRPVKYPDDLRSMFKGLPAAYHLALKAYIDGRWVLVDATYDPALKKADFPVNEKWDGKSDTLNAVTPQEEIIHNSVEERVSLETQRKSLQSDKEKAAYAEFVDRLNKWLVELRQ